MSNAMSDGDRRRVRYYRATIEICAYILLAVYPDVALSPCMSYWPEPIACRI